MINLLQKLIRDEHGMETVEWAVMAGLVVAGTLALTGLGLKIQSGLSSLRDVFPP